ncbi:class IV adenylate cyclase [Clostridium sp. DL1XJH146]
MHEIETRIVDINVCEIREKLKSLGAKLVKKENQINNIFDFNDGSLLKNKGYARIRIVEDCLTSNTTSYMTTKKLLSQENYKIMEENETIIASPIEGTKIFKSLGLALVHSIKKYRESYQYNNTLIEIDINDKDFFPLPYIEIESKFENEIQQVVTLLGYTMSDTTSQTIYELKKQYNI